MGSGSGLQGARVLSIPSPSGCGRPGLSLDYLPAHAGTMQARRAPGAPDKPATAVSLGVPPAGVLCRARRQRRGAAAIVWIIPMQRRHLLGLTAAAALPAIGGCATPLSLAVAEPGGSDAQAQRWLRESAERHGDAAYKALNDINVAYAGRWRALIDRIQPEVVDKPWRAASEERLLPRAGVIAQAHRRAERAQAGVPAFGHERAGTGRGQGVVRGASRGGARAARRSSH